MPFVIAFFSVQLVLAVATVVVVSRLFAPARRLRAAGDGFVLIGAAMATLLALSARGLYVASSLLQSEIPAQPAASDWMLAATGAVTLAVFAAYGRLLVHRTDLEQSVRDLSATDGLTGVYNKRAFMTLAAPFVHAAQRFRQPLSALVLDIDHFARINDEFGRAAGDRSLSAVGGVLGGCLRKIDVPGRLSGEKFAVVLPHTDLRGAILVAERLCEAVNRKIDLTFDGQPVRLTASVGVATLHDGNLDNLLNIADGAMYVAKRNGRNRVAVEDAEPV